MIELLDEQSCALSALDIEDELRARDGRRVGRASIYRVVDELVTLGLLTRVEVGDGVARYEPQRPGHHHHLVCDGCGRLEPFQDDALERAIHHLAERVVVRRLRSRRHAPRRVRSLPLYLDDRLGNSTAGALSLQRSVSCDAG